VKKKLKAAKGNPESFGRKDLALPEKTNSLWNRGKGVFDPPEGRKGTKDDAQLSKQRLIGGRFFHSSRSGKGGRAFTAQKEKITDNFLRACEKKGCNGAAKGGSNIQQGRQREGGMQEKKPWRNQTEKRGEKTGGSREKQLQKAIGCTALEKGPRDREKRSG